MMKDENNRILYLDYARTIALFLVVFAHLYSVDSSVKLYVYAFHMPFFFIVSGMLHRDSDYIPLKDNFAIKFHDFTVSPLLLSRSSIFQRPPEREKRLALTSRTRPSSPVICTIPVITLTELTRKEVSS